MGNLVNAQNFIRWTDLNPTTDPVELPHPYRMDRGGCPYMPVAYPTEIMAFYINSVAGFTSASFSGSAFSDLRLDLVDARTNLAVNTNIGSLNQVFVNGANYNIWSSFTIPAAITGMYYLRIIRIASGIPVLQSNYILVRNDKANLDLETVYVRFRHERQFYNIRYQDLPSFYQRFRIHLNVIEEQLETDTETYREITTGKIRTSENYIGKYVRFEAYYMDDQSSDACALMAEHDFLEINGKSYSKKSTYKKDPNQLSKYAKGQFEAYDNAFSSVNRC